MSRPARTVGRSRGLRWRVCGRSVSAVCLAGVLVVALGAMRPDDTSGLPSRRFWAMKVGWRNCADLAVAGDSRVNRGISPAAMAEHLPGLRIINCGFSGVGYSHRFLQHVAGTLRGDSSRKTIVLGITPHSLTPGACKSNGFRRELEHAARRSALSIHLAEGLAFFRPMSLREAYHGLLPGRRRRWFREELFADGWAAGMRTPHTRRSLEFCEEWFRENQVSQDTIGRVLEAARRWSEQGIEVYAFRPPAAPALDRLEDRESGFDERAFARAFEAAGGTWLDPGPADYESYDGSHLDRHSAVKLSKRLALKIAAARQANAPEPVRRDDGCHGDGS